MSSSLSYTTVAGKRVHFATHRPGPTARRSGTLIAVHQIASSHRMYDQVGQALARRGYEVVCPDLPGFGQSEALDGSITVELLAEWLIAFAGRATLGPIALLGHHFGASISLEAAVNARVPVGALVLSGLPLSDARPERQVAREMKARSLVRRRVRKDGSHLLAEWQRITALSPASSAGVIHGQFVDSLLAARTIEAYQASFRYDSRSALRRLTNVPVLVLGGTSDRLYRYHDAVSRAVRSSKQATIRGRGAFMMLEQSRQVAEIVARFLGRPRSGRAVPAGAREM